MQTGKVLICAPTGRDGPLLVRYLLRDGVPSVSYQTVEILTDALDENALAVIVAEEALHPRGVERLVEILKNQPRWSDITLVLLTQNNEADSRASSGLVHLFGVRSNVSMLERPLRVPALISAVRSALRARNRQYEVRDLLQQRERNEVVLQEAREDLESRVVQRTLEITKVNCDLRHEVTELMNAANALRQLSQNVVRLQDEERRRIARELHDSAGQYLSAVSLTLGQLARRLAESGDRNRQLVQEALDLVSDCIKEIRTMSYLLHPPALDDFGLAPALRWYVEGFSSRSGINVGLDLAEDFPRYPLEVETALFRIVQEGLTNVHRHSGGQKASVEVRATDRQIVARITDNGHGMSQDVLFNVAKGQGGVGLMGMYERVKKLGGSIHIDSGVSGTTIKAELPVQQRYESSAASAN